MKVLHTAALLLLVAGCSERKPAQVENARLMKVTIGGKTNWTFEAGNDRFRNDAIYQHFGVPVQSQPDERTLLDAAGKQGWKIASRKAPEKNDIAASEEIQLQREVPASG